MAPPNTQLLQVGLVESECALFIRVTAAAEDKWQKTVEDVAERLHCQRVTVVRQGCCDA